MLGYVPDWCQEGLGGEVDDDIHGHLKEGGGMRGVDNASTAISPDNQGIRQRDNGPDREDNEERNGYATKNDVKQGVLSHYCVLSAQ